YVGNPVIGQDSGMIAGLPPNGIAITADAAAALSACDVAIDFSSPLATCKHAKHAADRGISLVVGTTGLAAADETVLKRASERTAIVYAANFSVGMNLLADLVKRAAARLGPDFDIEILEMHHRHKVDSPSG